MAKTTARSKKKSVKKTLPKSTVKPARTTSKTAAKAEVTPHGGAAAKGRRKTARPLVLNEPMTIIMKSSRAKGAYSLLKKSSPLEALIREIADRHNVNVIAIEISATELSMNVSFKKREDMGNFLRLVSSLSARLVTGARKGKPFGKFWDNLAQTKVA